ncbi:sn-glycerol-3-phosphate ABC transporter ATP-binding protein UgpC [Brevibacterium samyangense]|uniref:Sn-glycerol-3-phosphate ABC transporter ATP-binding protein UgpC n=1 Tax=Brevibacterium samyangense TaxID=366888 RepID=A0ABN2T6D7_9MICO
MVDVSLQDVSLRYPGAEKPAVQDVNLRISDGEFLVLVGPSGCGKSTTLRMLAGLELPTGGRIDFGTEDVTGLTARERDVAMVFQSYALYPHMTVAGNMEFALKNQGMPAAERRSRIHEAAALLELDQLLDRKPRQLSGGQRQRVAMGRAIVRQPQVFLMDEPLSNLDAKLRVQTRAQISSLQRRLGVTTVYVTHDQTEAMTMGDRVVVMNQGRVEQIGTPRELYDRPATLFVAGFIGSPTMNLVPASVDGNRRAVAEGVTVPLPTGTSPQGPGVMLGIRPEDITAHTDTPGTPGGGAGIDLEVQLVEELGSDSYVYAVHPGDLTGKALVARMPKGARPATGSRVTFEVDPSKVLVFDSETEQLLG